MNTELSTAGVTTMATSAMTATYNKTSSPRDRRATANDNETAYSSSSAATTSSSSSWDPMEDVDICVTCLTVKPPILPLREELPSLGVEVIYKAKGKAIRTSRHEARKKLRRYRRAQAIRDWTKRRFFPKSSQYIRAKLAERQRVEHELKRKHAVSYERYQHDWEDESTVDSVSTGTNASSSAADTSLQSSAPIPSSPQHILHPPVNSQSPFITSSSSSWTMAHPTTYSTTTKAGRVSPLDRPPPYPASSTQQSQSLPLSSTTTTAMAAGPEAGVVPNTGSQLNIKEANDSSEEEEEEDSASSCSASSSLSRGGGQRSSQQQQRKWKKGKLVGASRTMGLRGKTNKSPKQLRPKQGGSPQPQQQQQQPNFSSQPAVKLPDTTLSQQLPDTILSQQQSQQQSQQEPIQQNSPAITAVAAAAPSSSSSSSLQQKLATQAAAAVTAAALARNSKAGGDGTLKEPAPQKCGESGGGGGDPITPYLHQKPHHRLVLQNHYHHSTRGRVDHPNAGIRKPIP